MCICILRWIIPSRRNLFYDNRLQTPCQPEFSLIGREYYKHEPYISLPLPKFVVNHSFMAHWREKVEK